MQAGIMDPATDLPAPHVVPGCVDAFQADPEQTVALVEEEEASCTMKRVDRSRSREAEKKVSARVGYDKILLEIAV